MSNANTQRRKAGSEFLFAPLPPGNLSPKERWQRLRQLFQRDHLGSTRLITDLSGNTHDSLDFLPFGEQIAGGTGSTHKFTGYERDAESNLDNAQARYYSSSMGRFMSPDPYNAGADPYDPQS